MNAESLDQTRAKAVAQIFAGQPCNTQHLGRWPNPHNVQEFFECAVNVDSMPTCSDVPSSLSRQIMQDLSMVGQPITFKLFSSFSVFFSLAGGWGTLRGQRICKLLILFAWVAGTLPFSSSVRCGHQRLWQGKN